MIAHEVILTNTLFCRRQTLEQIIENEVSA
jgi:hypothetical protein